MPSVRDLGPLIASVDGSRGELVLNRPDSLNALGGVMLEGLIAAARWFDDSSDVKVVVVRGEGRAFSAGADVAVFAGGLDGRDPRRAADLGRQMADAVEAMRAVTIAAIRGHCIGGGVVLAAACDLRVAADDAHFSIPEVDLGIPLAWGGIPRLVRELGPALTKELVMTCRPFTAAEGRSAGFINRVVPSDEVDDAVEELAATLAAKPRHALLSTKRHVNVVADSMVGTSRSWADADGLLVGLADAEGQAAAAEYLRKLGWGSD